MASNFYSFGPPNIFSTQADTYQNSFSNPMNSANMNRGWGINSNLLTPSYQAPYRPQYSGAQPYNNFGRVGFFGGVNHLFNPTNRDPSWGTPTDHAQPSIEGISGRPFDATAWAGQRIIAPALMFGGAMRALAPTGLGGYFTGQGIGAGMGQAVGSGFAKGIAGAFGVEGLTAGAIGGVAGSLIGGLAVPYLAAQAGLAGVQKALWNPYINTRQSGMDLRRNFGGVSFGDARGNSVTGGGLGYQESNRMASDITRAGIQDMTFSTSQYAGIADMSARAGLMDNVKSKQITQRVKDVAEQIKLIMAISKDPDIKNAIEELSKLNLGGANLTGGRSSVAAGAYRTMGSLASQAGVSVQRMMSTIGAQGQYLFQSNGMTPYLGQMAAGNVFAGFSAAQRVGLMSPAALARMGGVEGATQSSLTGMVNASQTPYNQMALYNQYIGGAGGSAISGRNQNLMNIVSTFGSSAARNPLKTMGGMTLYGAQMSGKQLAGQGAAAIEDQMVSLMSTMGVQKNKNGKYDAETMVPFLQQSGMSRDEIIAFINNRAADMDPTTANQRIRGINTFTAEQARSAISQNFMYGGTLGRGARAISHFGRDVVSSISDAFVSPVTNASGAMGDALSSLADSWQFGSTIGKGMRVSNTSGMFQASAKTGDSIPLLKYKMTKWEDTPARTTKVIDTINSLAKSGDSEAIAFLKLSNPEDRKKALGSLIRNNKDSFGDAGKEVLSGDHPEYFSQLLGSINTYSRSSYTMNGQVGAGDRVTKAFQDTIGGHEGLSDSMQAIGAAFDIEKSGADASTIDDLLKDPKYATLKRMVGKRTGADALSYINGVFKRSAATGTYEISSNAFNSGATLEAYKKNNGAQISDPTTRKRFQDAKNDTERQQILTEDQISKNGGVALGSQIKNAGNEDPSAIMSILGPMMDGNKQKQQLLEAVKSGRVDFSTAVQTMNSIDAKQSTKQFADAVDVFDQAVRAGSTGGNGTSTAPNIWTYILSGGKDDKQRVAGSTGPNTK